MLTPKYRQGDVRFTEIEKSGPPSPPLGFPAPIVARCDKRVAVCYDPTNGTCEEKVILIRHANTTFVDNDDDRNSKVAYLITGAIRLHLTLCGEILLSRVLELQDGSCEHHQGTESASTTLPDDTYVVTSTKVVIKMDKRDVIRKLHDDVNFGNPENPWKEVSALELLGRKNKHPNVLALIDALYDDQFLYEVMPYYAGGSLYQFMNQHQEGLPESQARGFFRQILAGIEYLHSKGVCHRDISTHNVLLNGEQNECTLIDFGMCLRVPYPFPDDHRTEDITDVCVGTIRRMIHSQSHCGKLRFISPETYAKHDFDGLTVDLWSAAVVLFVMLTGRHPYEKPDPGTDAGYHDLLDARYYWDPKGVDQVFSWGHTVSEEAVDLLKGMFRPDPRDRLTMAEVISHPWVTGNKFKS